MTKTVAEKIKIKFRRARHIDQIANFDFEEDCSISQILRPGEKCVVKIHARDGSFYHVTDQRIIQQKDKPKEIISYDEIKTLSIFAVEEAEARELYEDPEYADSVEFLKKNGEKIRIQYLGDSLDALALTMGFILRPQYYGG